MGPFLSCSNGGDHERLSEVLVTEIRDTLSGGPVGTIEKREHTYKIIEEYILSHINKRKW